jgi:hypothetical protein
MKDKYENMTSEQLTKAFEKLGIVKMIDRTESAEDPNIRFSRFDTCYISEIQYVDRLSEITRRYTRLSDTFERVYQVLKDWYEIDNQHYRRDKDFLSCDYGFTSKYDLPSIVIDINKFHNHLLHIRVGYDYDSQWYEVDSLEKDLTKILNDLLIKSDDINVIREIKLKSLLC